MQAEKDALITALDFLAGMPCQCLAAQEEALEQAVLLHRQELEAAGYKIVNKSPLEKSNG